MHAVHIPFWAVQRGLLMNHFPTIAARETALLVVDMQNYFVHGETFPNPHARDIIPNINRLVAAFREREGHIVWLRHGFTTQGASALPDWQRVMPIVADAIATLVPGSMAHAIVPECDVSDHDILVDKYRYGVFAQHSSDLHERLTSLGITTLVITGTMTNGCCEASARGGNMLGYRVLAVADAMATVTDEEHNASLLGMRIGTADIVSTDELIGRLP